MNSQKAGKNGPKLPKAAGAFGGILLGVGLAAGIVYNSIFTVEPGHAAVMFNRIGGTQDKVYYPGMDFIVSFLLNSHPYRISSKIVAHIISIVYFC